MLDLFRDKKCCNFINLFLCILWDLIVMDLVLSGENLIKTVEGHMGSTCQKLKSQCISLVISRLGNLSRWPTRSTDSWNFKCDSYTLHIYSIYPHYPQNCKEAIQRKTLQRFLQHTHILERATYHWLRIPLYSLFLPLSHCYTLRGD